MQFLSRTHTCLAIDHDDLVVSFVRTTPLEIHTALGPRIGSYLDASDADRSELAPIDGADKLTLVIPGAWCASRPMPLSSQRWEKSRSEIASSIDSIFPLSPDDALLEFIQFAPAPSSDESAELPAGGVLIAVSREQLAPWIEHITRDFGRAPDRIVSSHAALLGVGLQRHERAIVIEPDAVGAPMAHSFSHGEPCSFDESAPAGANASVVQLALPGLDQNAYPDASRIDAHDLASGAQIAERLCPGIISPFLGRRTPSLTRMAMPAVIAAVAILILATAPISSRARLQAGLDALAAEQATLAPLVDQVQQRRATTEQLIRNTQRVRALTSEDGEPMLSLLAAGHAVLPPDGYLYRARFTPNAIELRGQCSAVGDLLREIESSTHFSDAERLSPSAPVDGGATFDIAATVSNASAGAAP